MLQAGRPPNSELVIITPTMRLIFPVEGEATYTATPTPADIFPMEPTNSPTPTPLGYDPTPTSTLALIFPLDVTDTPVYCRSGSGIELPISGVVWLDKNGNGIRDAGEEGIEGIVVDLAHSTTRVRTNQDGQYTIPAAPNQWPVTIYVPSNFYSFDVQTKDSQAISAGQNEAALCFGSSYDVGIVPVLANIRLADTKTAQGDAVTQAPACAIEPNNPNCLP